MSWPRPHIHAPRVLLLLCLALLPSTALAAGETGAVPLTLSEALASAAAADETIGQAEQDLEAARADTAGAASALLPTPGASLERIASGDEMLFLRAGLDYPVASYKVWRQGLDVSTPLLAPSAIGGLVAAGRAERASSEALEATRYTVLYAVVRAYYEALSAHSAVEVAAASASAARTLEAAATSRLAAGTETRIGVERARMDHIAAEGAVEQARFAAHQADLRLAHAAHLPLSQHALTAPTRPTLPGDSVPDRVARARDARPDILAAHWRDSTAAASVHAAALGLAPELRLGFSWQHTLYDREDLQSQLPSERWTLGLQLDWSLPGIIGPGADIGAARAARRRAQLEVTRLERETSALVHAADLTLQAAEAALRVAGETDALARSNLEAGLRLYQEGLATGLEVTTLKTERDAAAAERVQAQLTRDLAEVDLLEVQGVEPRAAYGASGQ